ncbi:UNVERIFIED_CONTAM: hypothetical protein K2H54_035893 [Gekko kuhli]
MLGGVAQSTLAELPPHTSSRFLRALPCQRFTTPNPTLRFRTCNMLPSYNYFAEALENKHDWLGTALQPILSPLNWTYGLKLPDLVCPPTPSRLPPPPREHHSLSLFP